MFDVHSHKIENQEGGFILSIEGEPSVPGASNYSQLKNMQFNKNYFIVPYLHSLNDYLDENIIYIHPRRNRFQSIEVENYLYESKSSLVIIDTFSSFFWDVQEYFHILTKFPEKKFLLAHGGGYRIRDFVELCRYKPNAYIDFSATHEIFGCVQGKKELDCGTSALILHALHEPRIKNKVLFGSDNPEFSQTLAYEFYQGLSGKFVNLMRENYLNLLEAVT